MSCGSTTLIACSGRRSWLASHCATASTASLPSYAFSATSTGSRGVLRGSRATVADGDVESAVASVIVGFSDASVVRRSRRTATQLVDVNRERDRTVRDRVARAHRAGNEALQ